MKKLKTFAIIGLAALLMNSPMYAYAEGKKSDTPAALKIQKASKIQNASNMPNALKMTNIEMKNKDGDKFFDNLESKLETVSEDDKLPVIIQFDTAYQPSNAISALEKQVGNFQTTFEYKIINGIAATMTKQQIKQLEKIPSIKRVEYDEKVTMNLATANDWFGTTKARHDFGVTGDRNGSASSYSKSDVVVAVIDTGIDPNHVDLNNGKIVGWKDLINNRSTPYDDQGHGTHCASIATGEGEGNSDYKGVAPEAALVGVKVLDSRGSGSMSTVTAGIDWAVQNKDGYGINVISLSLGTSGSSDGTDSTSQAVNRAVDAGLVVVVAAGNSGPKTSTVGSPGAAEKAITVGAGADLGEGGFFLADFSSRGFTADGRIKPDIFAPGYQITAAQAGTTNSYVTYSGTSMATPFLAGTIALMLDANPALTPTQVANTLQSTAIDFGPNGKDIDYGHGRLDGYAAIKQAGNFSGTNISTPNHFYQSGSLPGTRYNDWFELNVNETSEPIAITYIMPDWRTSWFISFPDYDIFLYAPGGELVASSEGTKRQETITYTPTTTGTYKVRVYSYRGSGNYFFDLSAGATELTQTDNDVQ